MGVPTLRLNCLAAWPVLMTISRKPPPAGGCSGRASARPSSSKPSVPKLISTHVVAQPHTVIRPIWHWVALRVEAHVLVAFLGYVLWVALRQKLKASAPSLTPWQVLDQLGRIQLIDVWFKTRAGGAICLPRITQPETAQRALLHQLGWQLPEQPPPRIYQHQVPNVWET
jgi:hypothetical protein